MGWSPPHIPGASDVAAAMSRAQQMTLTKPPGSLGRLEELGAFYAAARGVFPVAPPVRGHVVVFAADHGLTAEGVSPYPSSVTAAMVTNFLAGGAAINVLARQAAVGVTVVDVGVAAPPAVPPGRAPEVRFVSAVVRRGTANLRRDPAMTRADAESALAVGVAQAAAAAADGADLLGCGEMGIGNTTAAAAVAAALTGAPVEQLVGRGTGVDDAGLARKVSTVAGALALHAPDRGDPVGVLAAVGGLEIAALAGLMLGAAARRLPVVVDGFIAGVAALVAVRLVPAARGYLCFSHLSAERGHRVVCEALDARPLLDLGLRLGEGTGAVLAMQLVTAAVRLQAEMATFASAGVAGRTD